MKFVMSLAQEPAVKSEHGFSSCTGRDEATSELPVNAWLLLLLRFNAAMPREQRG